MTNAIKTLLSGIFVTAHALASGRLQNWNRPTGWLHATFRLSGSTFYMRGENGSLDWRIGVMTEDQANILLDGETEEHEGAEIPYVTQARVNLAADAIRYLLGADKPEGVEVKAPANCARCGRKLTAGRSLTLQDGPCGRGFYGRDCGGHRSNARSAKHKAGLSAMDELIRKGRQ